MLESINHLPTVSFISTTAGPGSIPPNSLPGSLGFHTPYCTRIWRSPSAAQKIVPVAANNDGGADFAAGQIREWNRLGAGKLICTCRAAPPDRGFCERLDILQKLGGFKILVCGVVGDQFSVKCSTNVNGFMLTDSLTTPSGKGRFSLL